MPPLSVRLFGKLSISTHDGPVTGLDACKLQELATYILLFRESPHTRENLAALLWGDSPTIQSKKYLRQALWQLQKVLGARAEEEDHRVFQVATDWVAFNPQSDVWLDVADFENAFAVAREIPGQNLSAAQAERLEQAIQLYQGDLLEGWYQDWCICERERLQTSYLIMLDKLMNYCEAHEKYETGLAYGRRVLKCDRARESTHRRLMRLYYLAGDRTAALRQYEQCVAALDGELGVGPSRLTVTLRDQIRLDQFQPAANRTPVPADDDLQTLPKVIERLKNLRQALMRIHAQVQDDINELNEALHGRK